MKCVIGVLGRCNKYLCAVFLAVMVLLVFANTVLRYVFNSGIIMGEELVRFLSVWAVFLAAISVYYQHRHIAVTTLTDRLPPRVLPFFTLAADCLALYALYILGYGSLEYYYETTTIGQATGIPYRMMAVPVVIAAAGCFLVVAGDMYVLIRRIAGGGAAEESK